MHNVVSAHNIDVLFYIKSYESRKKMAKSDYYYL